MAAGKRKMSLQQEKELLTLHRKLVKAKKEEETVAEEHLEKKHAVKNTQEQIADLLHEVTTGQKRLFDREEGE